MARSTQGTKVDIEHIQFLTNIFQEVRTEGYMHDYDGDYKLIGMALKKTENYNMVLLMEMMEYFKKFGIKEVKSMRGWLIWAFKNPKTAMQPYNTIDLQKNRGAANDVQQARHGNSNNYYDNLFKSIDGTN